MGLTRLLKTELHDQAGEYRITPARFSLLMQRSLDRPLARYLPPPEHRESVYPGPVQFSGVVAAIERGRVSWFMETAPLRDPTELLLEIAGLCGELQSTMAQARHES